MSEGGIMRIVTEYKYIAEDGEVFDNEQSCLEHDTMIRDGGIFLFGSKITLDDLELYLCKGYRLANYSPGKLTIFGPPPSNGGYGNIYGLIADKLGKIHDPHNYGVYQYRLSKQSNIPFSSQGTI